MCALFKFAKSKPSVADAVQTPAPELKDAQLAAASYGQRTGGDLHDYIRVSPDRVLFAMIDVAGRLEQNRAIVAAAQDTLRSFGTQMLSHEDVNEADTMTEICV